jgi:hypothetical protein
MERRLAAMNSLGRVRKRRSTPGLRVIQRKLLGALFAIIGLMLWADAAAATPAGTVIGVSGSSTDRGRVLNRGDTVQIGDTLDVAAGGSLKLRMADGSTISAASGTNVTIANYGSPGSGRAPKLWLVQGLLRITSVTRPFDVSTAVLPRRVTATRDSFRPFRHSTAARIFSFRCVLLEPHPSEGCWSGRTITDVPQPGSSDYETPVPPLGFLRSWI